MSLSGTETWDAVEGRLRTFSPRWGEANKPMLRLLRTLRDLSATYELFPVLEGGRLSMFETESYDGGYRRLRFRFDRQRNVFFITHEVLDARRDLHEKVEWMATEEHVGNFLAEKLGILLWRAKKTDR